MSCKMAGAQTSASLLLHPPITINFRKNLSPRVFIKFWLCPDTGRGDRRLTESFSVASQPALVNNSLGCLRLHPDFYYLQSKHWREIPFSLSFFALEKRSWNDTFNLLNLILYANHFPLDKKPDD